jgi:hypothetical protein
LRVATCGSVFDATVGVGGGIARDCVDVVVTKKIDVQSAVKNVHVVKEVVRVKIKQTEFHSWPRFFVEETMQLARNKSPCRLT